MVWLDSLTAPTLVCMTQEISDLIRLLMVNLLMIEMVVTRVTELNSL